MQFFCGYIAQIFVSGLLSEINSCKIIQQQGKAVDNEIFKLNCVAFYSNFVINVAKEKSFCVHEAKFGILVMVSLTAYCIAYQNW